MKVGYARVSSVDQSLEIQLEQLTSHGCEKIFFEKMSGTKSDNREQLKAALAWTREGDVLVVTRLDRLARNVTDLLNIVRDLTERGIGFTVIHQSAIDTETPTGKMVLAIFGCLAEMENDLRRARTREGMQRALAAGKRIAPERKMDRDEAISRLKQLQAEGLTSYGAGKIVGYSSRHVKRLVPEGWPVVTMSRPSE